MKKQQINTPIGRALRLTVIEDKNGYIRYDFDRIGLGFGRNRYGIGPFGGPSYWINVYRKAHRLGLSFLDFGFGKVSPFSRKTRKFFAIDYSGSLRNPWTTLYIKVGGYYFKQETPKWWTELKERRMAKYWQNCPGPNDNEE